MQSYVVNPIGTLSVALQTAATLGANPQHIAALSTGKIMVVNTSTGSGRVVNTTDAGGFNVSSPVEYVEFPADWENEEVSNPSQVLEYKNELWIPDIVGVLLAV